MKVLIGFTCGIIFMMILGILCNGLLPKWTPSAIEVYQGKTTLEITYKDGVAIDSVVVYKNK